MKKVEVVAGNEEQKNPLPYQLLKEDESKVTCSYRQSFLCYVGIVHSCYDGPMQ